MQFIKVFLKSCLLIFLFLTVPLVCHARIDSVGFVDSVTGDVFITGSGTRVKAVKNMKISQGDRIETGEESSVGLIFQDDMVVSVGSQSEMIIDTFQFSPLERQLSFVARMLRGTFAFISGQIAKLAPEKVKLETPDAVLGVRGTEFLVKID